MIFSVIFSKWDHLPYYLKTHPAVNFRISVLETGHSTEKLFQNKVLSREITFHEFQGVTETSMDEFSNNTTWFMTRKTEISERYLRSYLDDFSRICQ